MQRLASENLILALSVYDIQRESGIRLLRERTKKPFGKIAIKVLYDHIRYTDLPKVLAGLLNKI